MKFYPALVKPLFRYMFKIHNLILSAPSASVVAVAQLPPGRSKIESKIMFGFAPLFLNIMPYYASRIPFQSINPIQSVLGLHLYCYVLSTLS